MPSYLVVANRTLPTASLEDAIEARLSPLQPARFHVVVPRTPVGHGLTWSEEETVRAAQRRLDAFVEHLRGHGAEADGEIGDPDPVQAVRDALRGRAVDEVILSTLPAGISRWLGGDVPSRLRDEVRVPVTVITVRKDEVAGGGP